LQEIPQIISKILNGDRSAERILYDIYKTRWYMLSMRYGNNKDEANDIMQEGLIQIFKDLHQFDEKISKFSTWSSRILVHAALKYIKTNQWQNAFLDIDNKDDFYNNEEIIYSNLAAKELTEMVKKLPFGYKLVFNMYVIEGYTHKEIAKELGIAIGTSKSQLSKAKRMLRFELEKQLKSYSNG